MADATATRPLPTFSALPRAFACAASCVLPAVEEHGKDSAAGTVRHRFLHRISDLLRSGMAIDPARTLALAEADEKDRFALAVIPVRALRLESTVAEVALAIHGGTLAARELGRAIERRYDEAGRGPDDFAGSVDGLGMVGETGVIVRDFKGRSHTRRPCEDEQVLAGALAAVRIHRRRWADVEILRVIGEKVFPAKDRVAAPDLERFGERLVQLRVRIRQDREAYANGRFPPMTVGGWCRYCPSLRFCPAKMSLLAAATGSTLPDLARTAKAGQPYATDANVAKFRERVVELERLVKKAKADLADLARQSPIRQSDGKVYGLTRTGVRAYRPREEVAHVA